MEEHYRHTDVTRKYITSISNGYFRGGTLIHRPKDFTLLSFTSEPYVMHVTLCAHQNLRAHDETA